MNYDFDRLIDRHSSNSGKWEMYPEDVLPLWVADMDFPSADEIKQALHERVEHGVFGYPGHVDNLRALICERMERLYDWAVQPEEIVFFPGLVNGLKVVSEITGERHRAQVLALTPVYGPFLMAPGMGERELLCVETPARFHDGVITYHLDFDAIEAAITPHTKLMQMCSPHNPIGRSFSREELERIAGICLKHDLILVSDDIHCDLLLNGQQHIPLATLSPELAARTVTLMAPSKTFNTAGLFCGYGIIQNPALRRVIEKRTFGAGVNLLGFTAAEAAYRYGQPWLGQMLAYLAANRDFAVNYIRNNLPGIRTTNPDSTYLLWLDCRGAGIEGKPSEFFLKEAKVALNDGAWFGPGGEGFVRLNFGCPRSVLAEGLERMRDALVRLAN